MKLFISSLIGGYEEERDAVAHAATVLRWEVLRAEDFGARPDTPRQACLEAVREAEVVVLVMGAHYGAIQDGGLSATHEEWREAAKSQKPTLVFVEAVDARDQNQRAFLEEVQGWSAGRFRESFSSPQELQDKVTRALSDLRAPGLADESEVAQRAVATLPESQRGTFGGGAKLDIAVAGGPRQQVLRPAEIEDSALINDLQREAMFSDNATLDPQSATKPSLNGGRLLITQDFAEVAVHADGTILISRSAMSSRGDYPNGRHSEDRRRGGARADRRRPSVRPRRARSNRSITPDHGRDRRCSHSRGRSYALENTRRGGGKPGIGEHAHGER